MQGQLSVGIIVILAISTLSFKATAENGKDVDPPRSWLEHWGSKHDGIVSRVYMDNNLAVYYDSDMEPFIAWPFYPLSAAWKYVKETYGDFGTDPHLYLILHENTQDFCLTGSYIQSRFDNRNTIDCSALEVKNWEIFSPAKFETLLTNLVEVVHLGAKGMSNDVDLSICGDNMWETVMYDIYRHLRGETDPSLVQWKTVKLNEKENGAYWFRDWFLPIYETYGGASVLNDFYALLKENLAREKSGLYKSMNMGEFVHFWSEAAGEDLEPLARNALEWSEEYEGQLSKARVDYPSFHYLECGWELNVNVLRLTIFLGILVSILAMIFVVYKIKVACSNKIYRTMYQQNLVLTTADDDDEELIKTI